MDKDFIQSLEKGLLVIRAFDAERPSYTLADMSRETGLSRAACRRVLMTLQALGYIGSKGRHYFLLPRVLELGYTYLSSIGLAGIAQPHIEALNEKTEEACSVGILKDDEVVYIARTQGRRIMTVALNLGDRLNAAASAIGRVLLAALTDDELDGYLERNPLKRYTDMTVTSPAQLRRILRQVREQGWAVVDQELEPGFRTAAVPIHAANGEVVAAISVGVHASRVSMEDLETSVVPNVLSAVADIERELGCFVGPLVD